MEISYQLLPVGADTSTEPLIHKWRLNTDGSLDVTYEDGNKIRYFGIDPRASFLHPLDKHPYASFMKVRSQYRSEPI